MVRWSVGFFGVKDLFTLLNLFGGVLGITFAMKGRPDLGGYAILAGYFFGDALDGVVARATRTGNRFGSEFDSAADHIGQGIAPAVVLYAAYAQGGHPWLGLGLMATLIATASIRQARFNVAKFDFPLCYCGLPRTVSGFIALAFPNSILFFKESVLGYESGVALVGLMALLNLVPVPYMTHHGGRKMQWYVKVAVVCFLATPAITFVLARPFTFDVLFVWAFGYATTAWIPVLPEERRAFYAEYRRWSGEVTTLK